MNTVSLFTIRPKAKQYLNNYNPINRTEIGIGKKWGMNNRNWKSTEK